MVCSKGQTILTNPSCFNTVAVDTATLVATLKAGEGSRPFFRQVAALTYYSTVTTTITCTLYLHVRSYTCIFTTYPSNKVSGTSFNPCLTV